MNKPFMRWTGLALLAVVALPVLSQGMTDTAHANALPREERVPGGIAVLDIGSVDSPAPEVQFGRFRVPVLRAQVGSAPRWLALVGLPLSQPEGPASIALRTDTEQRELSFSVGSKAYAVQKLTVAAKYVEPPAEVLARIEREQAELNALFAGFSALTPDFILHKPAAGIASSSFGLRREFNGVARSPHSGMDIAGAKGEPVSAAGSGKVLLAKDLYFNGNTVIIDHGASLLTLYCHLDSMAVEPGQTVKAGSHIGNIGATGRVTGPHLHWSVSLSGARVNPDLFLKETPPSP